MNKLQNEIKEEGQNYSKNKGTYLEDYNGSYFSESGYCARFKFVNRHIHRFEFEVL